MICPYCGAEMEQGYLQGVNRVAWVKSPRKISLLPKAGEIMLENNSFKSFLLRAAICKACKKIVVDYADKKIVEG